jgi:hypothetical protein
MKPEIKVYQQRNPEDPDERMMTVYFGDEKVAQANFLISKWIIFAGSVGAMEDELIREGLI